MTFPDLPFVLSFTALNDYRVCPKRAWHKHVKKDIPAEVKTREQRGGTHVHDALKKRLKIREPLPLDFAQHEGICATLEAHDSIKHMELKLGVRRDGSPCDFFASDVAIRGALDLVCSNSPCALIVDWKSGKPWEDAFELKVQTLLLASRYPDLRQFTGFYYWLRTGKVGTLHELDPARAWLEVTGLAQAIASRIQRLDFPPDEGPLCPWCPVPKGVPANPLDPVCAHRRDPQ